ncbi:ABC transporter permease [Aquimarina agarivorans]|uniref:ABC transporter permease n=1 Tax=Aquimarina agarivorans TaxID=980584 RepID=UPI000248FAB0|nr:DUF3526 domain-containing protein [Aquimarina agarivorans]
MKKDVVLLIAKQFFKKTLSTKGFLVLLGIFLSVLVYVTFNGWTSFKKHQQIVTQHQKKARASWEANPDKHPHRMAHFGTFVFRQQHPLRIFDSGLESYTGNAIFLEAHKQNTANFSEASLATGLMRFGDLSIAMLLQLILPLIIFFIGYASITTEKENGTLKMIYLQGASMKDVLLGKSVGLFFAVALFFLPSLLALWSISFLENYANHSGIIPRALLISVVYLVFLMLLCATTIIVSALSENSNKALLTLLGIWLLFFIIIPKIAQSLGNATYPNLSKTEFKAAVEAEVIKKGDSHNPNDPYFNSLRDSILKANKVATIEQLPFNYSGYLMSKGESQTAKVYNKQHNELIATYKKQNSLTNKLVLFNPYLAIKNLSMGFSGTNFSTYADFLKQTEVYRYKQSQYMNNLQMKFISNKAKSSEGKVNVVDKVHWKSFPKFNYQYLSVSNIIKNQWFSLASLGIWMFLIGLIVVQFSNRFKII